MKRIFLLIILFFFNTRHVLANYDPLSVPNNRYGIHIVDPNDVSNLPKLVNSSGGDWGYVTLVIPETDRDVGKWQTIFNTMRRLHLIPIVRLATSVEKDYWRIPRKDSFDEWVDFLTKLNWVVENRYVILFNEPNHAKEWGNTLNPEEYATVLIELSQKLKTASSDFFILPAGLDVSAHNDGIAMDASEYLERMVAHKPEVLTVIDGWSSHAYPNPAFSGSPSSTGRGTLSSYVWELEKLSMLGLSRQLPVFITETGWVHNSGKSKAYGNLSPEEIGNYIKQASGTVWNDPRIAAITPFVYSYQDVPFDTFSWKKIGSDEFHAHYAAYQEVSKQAGWPKQRQRYDITKPILPKALVTNSTYTLEGEFQNNGQSIVTREQRITLTLNPPSTEFTTIIDPLQTTEPGEKQSVRIHIKTPEIPATYSAILEVNDGRDSIILESQTLSLVPPPSLEAHAQLAWRTTSSSTDATILVYDTNHTLLHKFTNVKLENGNLSLGGLTGIVPGKVYRVVILVPYYLPRQIVAPLSESVTDLTFKRLYPLDQNNDGMLSFADALPTLTSQPLTVLNRWFSF